MGLVKIGGKNHRINHEEASAIAFFIPPPMVRRIDWEKCTDGQTWLISEIVTEWDIIASWLVSFRTRTVDTRQMPFTSARYLDLKAKAELFSEQLDLCAEIWEVIDVRKHYPTPYDWWIDCVLETQRNQITQIFENPEGVTKGEQEDNIRKLLKSLKEGDIPFQESEMNTHLYRMLNSALKLKKGNKRVRKAWDDYLKALKAIPVGIKANKEIKSLRQMAGKVFYRQKNTHHLIPIQRVSKEALLTRTSFAV